MKITTNAFEHMIKWDDLARLIVQEGWCNGAPEWAMDNLRFMLACTDCERETLAYIIWTLTKKRKHSPSTIERKLVEAFGE